VRARRRARVKSLKQLPRVGFEVGEPGKPVAWLIVSGLLDGFPLMAGWHEYRPNEERVGSTVRLFEHNRLKLRLAVLDASRPTIARLKQG
jgi:hypothetical protein